MCWFDLVQRRLLFRQFRVWSENHKATRHDPWIFVANQPELMAESVADGRTSRNCGMFDAFFVATAEIATHETDVVRLDHLA